MGSSSKLRVLVVEDDIAMSDLFKKELRIFDLSWLTGKIDTVAPGGY